MNRILSAIAALLAISLLPVPYNASAQKQRTTRPHLSVTANGTAAPVAARHDTVTVTRGVLTVSGYEKPLRSTRESALFSNHSERPIRGLSLDLSYTDMKGRELHRRSVKLECDIPPHATRQIYWPTWDRQFTFYYHRSPKPRRGLATPYNVSCRVDTILMQKQ